MIKVLITGKDSQLAQCIKDIEKAYPKISFTYKSSKELDITNKVSVKDNFEESNYDYCINCAAYTAVDKAETETEISNNVNTLGALNLARACNRFDVKLIHISTDFVFDGEKRTAYLETDKTNPLSVYGITKRDGENEIIKTLKNYYIIRTSWLYSEYGNNFFKTILRLAKEKKEINVVNNQYGTPTYAKDLVEFILRIILTNANNFGLYNFSNLGETSWFGFALKIKEIRNLNLKINPIPSESYKTEAMRPIYSVLDKTKVIKQFDINISDWETGLNTCSIAYNKGFL